MFLRILLRFFPEIFPGLFVLCFLGNGDHKKSPKILAIFQCQNPRQSKRKIHKSFLESGQAIGHFFCFFGHLFKFVTFCHCFRYFRSLFCLSPLPTPFCGRVNPKDPAELFLKHYGGINIVNSYTIAFLLPPPPPYLPRREHFFEKKNACKPQANGIRTGVVAIAKSQCDSKP